MIKWNSDKWGKCGENVGKVAIFDSQRIQGMATIKFLLKGKNDLSTIYVRLRDGRTTDLTVSTGYSIDPDFWNDKKGEVRQTARNNDKLNLQKTLTDLERFIADELNDYKRSGTSVNREWLDLTIQKSKGLIVGEESTYLGDLLKRYQSILNARPVLVSSTIRGFNTSMSRLKKFEEHKKKRFLIHEVDLTFYEDFVSFFRKNGLSENSIGSTIKHFKTVAFDARDRGIKISEQVVSRKFSVVQEKTIFTTLNEIELDKIRTFEGANYLENARDWLIIGCWTACRVNDLMALTNDNIQTHISGKRFLRYTQSKTGKTVDVLLHNHVIEIIDRLGGFPRAISDTKFNEYIKELCLKVGLTYEVHGTRQNPKTHRKETGMFPKWQLIRSHTCRRSFATNLYKQLPNKTIMAVTGHATERMLLNYIGEVENDHLEDFSALWSVEKNDEVNTLKVLNA